MATFKVGQRVRLVWMPPGATTRNRGSLWGREGTIVSIPSESVHALAECDVELDGAPAAQFGFSDRPWAARFCQLAPLLGPEDLIEVEREPVKELA